MKAANKSTPNENISCTLAVGGEAGQGIMTVGLLFSKLCARSGLCAFNYSEYPSLIRGGHNVTFIHFGKGNIYSQESKIDLLVALNKETVDLHKNDLKGGGAVVYDADDFLLSEKDFLPKTVSLFPVPFESLLTENSFNKVAKNTLALGAAAAVLGFDAQVLLSLIEDAFKGKGEAVADENKKAAQLGFDAISRPGRPMVGVVGRQRLVISGNEAVGLGALAAGCSFYAAYPMTPSSSLLHFMAENGPRFGAVVRHAEDEIGVINEAIGASFAGARAMVGTSGGGFALMNEAVSLAGITELPLVIMVSQRPGPATGMPTWTEQGDLQFVIRSGHGEFPKIVLAPGDAAEAFALTIKAFELADIYRTPVFILSDKYLSESLMSVEASKFTDIVGRNNAHARSISPWANSYEHDEEGFSTEDAAVRKSQVEKRFGKMSSYFTDHFQPPALYGDEEAPITFVGWGSVRCPVLEAMKSRPFNFLHFNHVWPLDGERVKSALSKHKKLVLVENNFTGQLGQLLRQETGIEIKEKLLKFDGRPFYPEEIEEYASQRF